MKNPSWGIEWRTLLAGDPESIAFIMSEVPEHLRPFTLAAPRLPYDHLRSRVARLAEQCCRDVQPDVLIPNNCPEGWLLPEFMQRYDPRPAVIAVLNQDARGEVESLDHVSAVEHVLAVSERLRDRAEDRVIARGRTSILDYGVPMSEAPPRQMDEEPFRILYSGRIQEIDKRVSDLTRVASRLMDLGVKFHLDIVGDGPDRKSLELALGAIRGLSHTFHGRVQWHCMDDHLMRAQIINLTSNREGKSISMMEGMGHGLVPVVTDVSGARDVIEDGVNGFIVPIGDVEAMAQRIKLLADDHDRLQQMRHAAWRRIKGSLDIESAAQNLAQVLKQATQLDRPPYHVDAGHPRLTGFRLDKWWMPPPMLRMIRKARQRKLAH